MKYTLVTGTNGGVGYEVVSHLLAAGERNLVCQYRSGKDRIEQLLTQYDLDPTTHLFQADLTSESEVKSMQAAIKTKLGAVSHVVNIAGASTNGMSWKLSFEDFQKVIADNLFSTFLVCKTFIPDMREAKYGKIVNTSSVVAFSGVAGASHYCAAKAAIVGYSKAISLELAGSSVSVNTLALGYMQFGLIDEVSSDLQEKIKAQIPMKRFGSGNEVGALVQYLLSDHANYITGQVLHLNGGLY